MAISVKNTIRGLVSSKLITVYTITYRFHLDKIKIENR